MSLQIYFFRLFLVYLIFHFRISPTNRAVTVSAPGAVTVSIFNINKTKSDISGTVDRTSYTSSTPIQAVLVNSSGVVIATNTVGASGNYAFPSIAAGSYTVVLKATATAPAVGSTVTVSSDLGFGYAVTPNTRSATVLGDGANVIVPVFTISKTISDIAGTVNRTSYTSSTPIHAVLINSAGNVVATDEVSATGDYGFSDIAIGSYTVVLKAAATAPAVGSAMSSSSDLGFGYAVSPNSQSVSVPGGGVVTVPIFNVSKTISDIVGTVNRTSYTSSTPIHAVLINSSGNVVAADEVSATGDYGFVDISLGTYTVVLVGSATAPAVGSAMASSSDLGYGYAVSPNSQSVTVPGGGVITVPVFNITKTVSNITGTVNRLSYTSPTPIHAVLINSSGNVAATQVVDVAGSYGFTDVLMGDYTVVLVAGATAPTVGSALASSSNVGYGYSVTPNSQAITVPGGGGSVTVPVFNIAKTTSDILGYVNLTGYASSTPIYAALVDGSGSVVATGLVNSTFGNYGFTDVLMGSYNVVLVAGTTAPLIGSTIAGPSSNLGAGYTAVPNTQAITVPGGGGTVTVPLFNISWTGGDLRTTITASSTSVSTGSTATISYRVFNIGPAATTGTIYLVLSKPSAGTLTLGTLPTGWSVFSATSTGYILETSNSIPVGPLLGTVITATYSPASTISLQNLSADIPEGFGGGERNTTNNTSSRQILINY